MDKYAKMKDFLASIVLFLLSVFVLIESRKIYVKAGKELYVSPALIPAFLGCMLFILSIMLFLQSTKEGGVSVRISEAKALWKDIVGDSNTVRMLIGFIMMLIYTFGLLGRLPFSVATFIFMVALMKYLEAGSWIKVIAISALSTGLIILLFQVAFRVPLP